MQHLPNQPNKRRRRRTWKSYLPILLLIAFLVLALLLAAFFIFRTHLRDIHQQGMEFFHPLDFEELILRYSEEHDLDPFFVMAVIRTESSFNPEAVSPVGARGLMQIMPDTAVDLAARMGINHREEYLFLPAYNIRMGTFYLRRLLDYFGEQDTALAAYNGGWGNVSNWLQDPQFSLDGRTLHHIPFTETRNYVERVNQYMEIYRELYADALDSSSH